MRQRFGALLCMLLGAVLITTGLGAGDATAGSPQPGPTCRPTTDAVVAFNSCPTASITVNETTVAVPGATATPPSGGWTVVITSDNCTLPDGGTVNISLSVANDASAKTTDLFVFADSGHEAKCNYALAPAAVTDFTATLVPPSPITIPFDGEVGGATVELTETPAAPTSSSASSSQPASSTPATSAAPSESATEVSSSAAAGSVAPTATTAPLAETGPRTEVTVSLWLGVGLLALGMVLLLSGARPARHGRREG